LADAPEVVNPIDLAEAACIKAGLTFGGIKALCHKANQATSLSELPFEVLDYIINNGIAADKVAMFNAQGQPEPEAEDDDELPAAWAA
jgi:hypothetical protein